MFQILRWDFIPQTDARFYARWIRSFCVQIRGGREQEPAGVVGYIPCSQGDRKTEIF